MGLEEVSGIAVVGKAQWLSAVAGFISSVCRTSESDSLAFLATFSMTGSSNKLLFSFY